MRPLALAPLALAALSSVAGCGLGGRDDLPTPLGCGNEVAEDPRCPSGTGLEAIGPDLPEESYARAVVVDGADVYFTTISDVDLHGSVWRIPGDGGAAVEIAANQYFPNWLAVDEAFVYWASGALDDALHRAPKQGGEPHALPHPDSISGIASDGTSAYASIDGLYRIDEGGELVNLSGSDRVFSIVADNATIYGTSGGAGGATGVILALDLDRDGDWRTLGEMFYATPVTADGALGLAIDNENVYWMSSESHSLFRVSKRATGADPHRRPNGIAVVSDIDDGQGVIAGGGYIYWAEKGRIRRSTCDGSARNTLAELPGAGMGELALDDTYVYFTTFVRGDRVMRVCR